MMNARNYRQRKPAGVAVAGDWHGDAEAAIDVLETLEAQGVDLLLHLGDFGFWPGVDGRDYLDEVNAAAERLGIEIWVTPGNHEWWSQLRAAWDGQPQCRDLDGNELPLPLRRQILMLPRGWRFTLNTPQGRAVSFVSFGGAPSIDFTERRRGTSWWPEEAITAADVAWVAAGGYADVMLTHDSPGAPWATEAVIETVASTGGWTRAGLNYAREGTELMTVAFRAVAPRWLFHGHFHVADRINVHLPRVDYSTWIVSLNCERMPGNVLILDLDEMLQHDSVDEAPGIPPDPGDF